MTKEITDQLLLAEIHQLPESLKWEVLHFILFLRKEYAPKMEQMPPSKRIFGRTRGKYTLAADFDAPLEDFKDYM